MALGGKLRGRRFQQVDPLGQPGGHGGRYAFLIPHARSGGVPYPFFRSRAAPPALVSVSFPENSKVF
jgi:hypothetical protein